MSCNLFGMPFGGFDARRGPGGEGEGNGGWETVPRSAPALGSGNAFCQWHLCCKSWHPYFQFQQHHYHLHLILNHSTHYSMGISYVYYWYKYRQY